MRKRIVALAGVGLLAAAIALGGAALLPGAAVAASIGAASYHGRGPADTSVGNDTYLAEALGITAEELATAQEKAYDAAIDQALEKGLITEAQAETLRDGTSVGKRGFGGLLRMSGADQIDEEALLADALGITVDDLKAAQEKAYDARLAQAVEDGRLTQEQADLVKARQALQQYIEDKGFYADAVAKAVEDGVITQAQAEAILSEGRGMGGFGGLKGRDGFGPGHLGGRGGHGRFDRGWRSDSAAPAVPTAEGQGL